MWSHGPAVEDELALPTSSEELIGPDMQPSGLPHTSPLGQENMIHIMLRGRRHFCNVCELLPRLERDAAGHEQPAALKPAFPTW